MTISNIPKSELKSRWDKIKTELNRNNKDALIIPLGVHFRYLFSKEGNPSERLIVGVIPRDGDPFLICPSFEKGNFSRSTGLEDIVTWEETESPYRKTKNEFDSRGIGDNIIADPKLWLIEVEMLEKQLNTKIISGNVVLEFVRKRKSIWEIKQLRKASQASSEGILASIPYLKTGITEIEFLKIVQKEMSTRSGSSLAFGLVQFGENSAYPHGMPSNKKLQNDEVVLIDCGTPVNGYQGDITITVPFGKPKDFKMIYDIVYDANRKALDMDKEGITGRELDNIARNYIVDKGYGEFFTHRLGHGIGLEVHEPPYIVGNNNEQLIENNCHTIEPGIYIPGKFGVRVEDDVLVGKNKAELLFNTPRYNFDH